MSPSEGASVFKTAEESSLDKRNQEDSTPSETAPLSNVEGEKFEVTFETEKETETNDDFPQGWTECMDENSGLPYYYNEIKNITTWDKPVCTVSTENEHQGPREEDNENEDLIVKNDSGADEKFDQTCDDFHVKLNGSSEAANLDPTVPNEAIPNQSGSENDDKEQPHLTALEAIEGEDDFGSTKKVEKEIDLVTQTNDLPSGWTELIDENSGLPYYSTTTKLKILR